MIFTILNRLKVFFMSDSIKTGALKNTESTNKNF